MDFFGVIDVPLWCLLLLMCLIALYIYGSSPMKTWEKLGVPGPKPLPFVGNIHQLFDSTVGVRGSLRRMEKKYGKIFGIHFFRSSSLVVLDLEALKEVFVKDFSNFSDRYHIGNGALIQTCVMKSLFFQDGMDWRRHRRIISPTFTSGKLKLITHYVNVTARQLSVKMEEHATKGTRPEAKTIFGAFSLDVIGGTAFGLNLDTQNNLDGPFFQHASKLFKIKSFTTIALGIASIFPFMCSTLHALNISLLDDVSLEFYKKQITKLVMERKTDPDQFEHADFLQLLLNAEMDANDDVVGEKKLTTDEVISSGILFIMAGYETTSNAMQFITYLLAKHHNVQDRLIDEINEVVGDKEDVSYEMCNNLKYMEAVINETLRMYPPIASINRKSLKATTLKGFPVPANTLISINMFSIGRDPDIYEDPDVYNPGRFMDGHDKSSTTGSVGFLPFGFGPRQCVGMRLAMLEIKIALVNMLRKVVIVDATPNDLELMDYTGILTAKVPIQLELVKR